MATAEFRNATQGPGFLPAPKPYVWERVEPNQRFTSDRYPGAWAEPLNDEAVAMVEAAVAAKKRKSVAAEGAANTSIVKPPSSAGMMALPQMEHYAQKEPAADSRPTPRRRQARAE